MTVADIAAVIRIRTSVKENHMSIEEMAALGITPQSIADMIVAEPSAWVADMGGRIVGFSMADRQDACLFAVFMDCAFEGLGIGRQLLKKAEDYLFGYHSMIWLETEPSSRAQFFYLSQGWCEAGHNQKGDLRLVKNRVVVSDAI